MALRRHIVIDALSDQSAQAGERRCLTAARLLVRATDDGTDGAIAALAATVETEAQHEDRLSGGRQLGDCSAGNGAVEGSTHGLIDGLGTIRPALVSVASAGPRGA